MVKTISKTHFHFKLCIFLKNITSRALYKGLNLKINPVDLHADYFQQQANFPLERRQTCRRGAVL
jgi:hypothetical protein